MLRKYLVSSRGGRLGLALRRTPSVVEGFPPPPPLLTFLAGTGPSLLAAPSFSSTVTQASLACPGGMGSWGALLAGSDEGDWAGFLDSPAWAYIQETFLSKGLHSVSCHPRVVGTRAPELSGPASLGGIWGEQGGPRNQTQGLFFWADFEQICLLARGGCAWHEAVGGGGSVGGSLRFPQWKFSPGLPFSLLTGEGGDPRCSERLSGLSLG